MRLLRYDYDKHGISVDRDGWFDVASVVRADPLRHFQPSQIVERLTSETGRFNVQGQKVRVYLTDSKTRDRRRTKAGTPDLLTIKIAKDNQTSTDDIITLWTDADKPDKKTTETLATSLEIYPTDARLRQKAREAEIKAGGDQPKDTSKITKRKKKDIEDHHDDCGNDLNSLLPFVGDELDVKLSTYLNSIFQNYLSGIFAETRNPSRRLASRTSPTFCWM